MGMRVLQLVMIVLLTGCVAWASAIFFGPWALTKYLEGQTDNLVEVSGLRVTPKLSVTASRVQMSDGAAVTASFRGVEVDWRLLTGDEAAVLISVSNAGFAGSLSVEDLQVTVTQAEHGDPLKILGIAARAEYPHALSALDVKFEAQTDYSFQFLRLVMATTGELTTQLPSRATASVAKLEVNQVDLGADLLRQDLSGALALTNLVVDAADLTMPDANLKFDIAGDVLSLTVGARDLLSKTLGVAISDVSGRMKYDATRLVPAGPIDVALNEFAWKDIRLPSANARVSLGDEQFKVLVEGESLGAEITLGRRYIGSAPDASFNAQFDVSAVGVNLGLSGYARLTAAQKPIELDLSFNGIVANASQLSACMEVACEISEVIYDYNLSVEGEMLSGTSRCGEPTCSTGGGAHELSTTDTNKFFANLQGVNLISPLVLGGAYAQMLQGVAVGAGHKINF